MKSFSPNRTVIASLSLVIVLSLLSGVLQWRKNQTQADLRQIQPLLSQSAVAMKSKDYRTARSLLETAVNQAPKSPIAQNNLGFACQQMRDFNCAESRYLQAIKLKNAWEYHKNLGSLYEQMRRTEQSAHHYQMAAKLAPSEHQSIIYAAWSRTLNRLRQPQEAEKTAFQGLNKASSPEVQAELLRNLSWAAWQQGDMDQASQWIEQANQKYSSAKTICLWAQIQLDQRKSTAGKTRQQCQTLLRTMPTDLESQPELQDWAEGRKQALHRNAS